MDLTVEGKIFVNGAFEQCCLGIKNGKIVEIKKILKGDEHLDFGKKLILPAGVDVHVHFRDPGMTHKEDFSTGSKAAAYGGIGCVFDMPNTIPQTSSVQNISDKIGDAGKKTFVDYGLYAGVTNENLKDVETLGKICNGFKIYLGNTTLSLLFDKKKLHEAMDLIGLTGKPVLLHCEDEECLIQNKKTESGLSDHMRFRPAVCEETSIRNVLKACEGLNTRVHVCHLSSCEGLELLKNRPGNVSCGVTPHHCLLSVERNMGSESLFKVNPPVRTSFDKESLFNALRNGLVDILESDHAPHTKEEKDVDFDEAPSGIPGVETMYPMFLYLATKKMLSFQRLISVMCARPANLLGVPKGRFETGFDADFIVVDLKNDTRIKAEKLHSRCGWTCFEDWPAVFPEQVFVRGEKAIDGDDIQVKPGFGRFVGA
jgi:dihydroorotase